MIRKITFPTAQDKCSVCGFTNTLYGAKRRMSDGICTHCRNQAAKKAAKARQNAAGEPPATKTPE